MGSKVIMLVLLCAWLFCEDQLLVVSRDLSFEEDVELENELKILNKPAVATIWTKYGEEYDCVDFYQQHAFDHPALKNHSFHPEIKPSWHPIVPEDTQSSSMTHQVFDDIWLNSKGCPTDSVPVKRVTKKDFTRIKLAEKIFAQTYDEPTTIQEHGTHYAVLRTNSGSGKELYGAGMRTSIYNPDGVTGTQYSSSQVKISNGVDSIEAGWSVNPSLVDNRSRVFIYTNAGGLRCLNECRGRGFVTIPQGRFVLGAPIGPVSQSGGRIYSLPFLIYKDHENWWLQIGNISVGYWPSSIFTSLKGFATFAEWGGKVYSPPHIPSPPMGAGTKELRKDMKYDAYCTQITTIDKSNQMVSPTDTSTYADIEQYKVEDIGSPFEKIHLDIQHTIVFGGPRGYIGN